MGIRTERELNPPRQVHGTGARPLVRRALWIAGTALAFVLLAVLGLGLGSLFSFGEPARPEPEPAPTARSAPRPVAEPAPPPPRPSAPTPVAAPAPPPPAPATTPEQEPLIKPPALPLPARLQVRQAILRGIRELNDELARCPADPVTRTPPTARAALVLDAVAEAGAVRLANGQLDAEGPVNDRFVSCARSVLEGKQFAVSGAAPGTRLRLIIPLGANGNSLSIPSASLTEAAAN